MFDWAGRQNSDGGWAYSKGSSWTEPTIFALLAQAATHKDPQVFEGGLKFVYSVQRSDGGWSPQKSIEESTWVTALVALLPEEAIGDARMNAALGWLKGQTGRESSWSYKLQQRFAGNKDRFPEGWPWFPGAAAWVIPTSFGVLAFERALRRGEDAGLRRRVDSGRDFLIARMCADGGWNHGGNRALGRDGDSYPETTGIALCALRGVGDSAIIQRAKGAAHRHLASCKTAEGTSWLRIGLAAHGEFVPAQGEPVERTILDAALTSLANSAPEKNPFAA
jgi:hypothetical protein